MDVEDVRKLLPPLLSLLDGQHDLPFPKDKLKGKELMNVLCVFKSQNINI